MTADRTETGPGPSKAQPDSAKPSRPPAPDGRDDEIFKQSMAELSRRLGERSARQSPVDPAAARAASRAALATYDRARGRQLIVGLGVAVAVVVGAGIAYLFPTVGARPVPPSPSAAARTEPAPPIEMATAAPAPAPPDSPSPSPAASVSYTPSVEPAAAVQAAPATGSQQTPVEPAPNLTPLRRDEAREVQARLRSFGFNPGPVDGVPGAMTEGAAMHYQQNRGQPQTGKVDRELLEQLRQDPAPQVVQQAQPAARPVARATTSPGARRSDPFEPVRTAGNRVGQWLESLTR
jgi:hypothetical protein